LHPQPNIENIPILSQFGLQVDTLRLDQIHPIVSGNKWYKLRYYLEAAQAGGYRQLASFGGPYSNHLVALAFAAQKAGVKSIGYVRSNQGEPITPSLQEALNYGMELVYLGRTQFQEKKEVLLNAVSDNSTYYVDEGGYGSLGAKGAATILTDWTTHQENELPLYDVIVCAVGTGTMMAGLLNGAAIHQKIIGIPVLKNEGTIRQEIQSLVNNKQVPFELLHQFHQGGYAKTTQEQIQFMNAFWTATHIPTDIVYTGKVFFAVNTLVNQKYFLENSKVLVIHSGGLQGNRSLAAGVLQF